MWPVCPLSITGCFDVLICSRFQFQLLFRMFTCLDLLGLFQEAYERWMQQTGRQAADDIVVLIIDLAARDRKDFA